MPQRTVVRSGAVVALALCASAIALVPTLSAQRAASASHAAFIAPPGSNVVTVEARDFALALPERIPAGLTTFRLLNLGKQQHHLSVFRLDSGKTPADALAALIAAGHGPRPAWMHPAGGPNAIMPGAETSATLELEPGIYLAFCEVPGPDPAPHFMKGMVKGFTVTGPARHAPLPKADLTVTLSDYAFTFSRPLTSGHHVIAVTNASSQGHMMVINHYPPGQGIKDFLAWAYDPKGKPAPGTALGGVSEISPGETVVIEEDFPPGHYSLLCFTADAKDGKPHFMHGMQTEFDVR